MFKSFFIYKILVHQKKKFEKSKKNPSIYFEDLKSVNLIWE